MGRLHRGSNRVTEGGKQLASHNQSETLTLSYQQLISKLLNFREVVSLAEERELIQNIAQDAPRTRPVDLWARSATGAGVKRGVVGGKSVG